MFINLIVVDNDGYLTTVADCCWKPTVDSHESWSGSSAATDCTLVRTSDSSVRVTGIAIVCCICFFKPRQGILKEVDMAIDKTQQLFSLSQRCELGST